MPYIHMYICANPLACKKADRQLCRLFPQVWRGDYAKYYMASYYHSRFNMNDKYRWW